MYIRILNKHSWTLYIHVRVHVHVYGTVYSLCLLFPSGVVQVSHLFWNRHFSDCLKRKYIQLLEKFEIALKISHSQVYACTLYRSIDILFFACTCARSHVFPQVLIPSLMPNEVVYPRPNDDLRGIKHFPDEFYVTVLRRFWLADFIPEGFWPRLICRVANDQQIEQVYTMHSTNYHTYTYSAAQRQLNKCMCVKRV